MSYLFLSCTEVLALLQSKMHMVWVKTIAGKLEERIRYTS
ncbi:type IIL restriction-modification enzyme MmeI, partial [Klebsiella pneumoniae]